MTVKNIKGVKFAFLFFKMNIYKQKENKNARKEKPTIFRVKDKNKNTI